MLAAAPLAGAALLLFPTLGTGAGEKAKSAVRAIAGKVAPRTVDQAIGVYGKAARRRMAPHFKKARIDYPPSSLCLLALKQEMRLDIYSPEPESGNLKLVISYPILAASGDPGPKLKQGDSQVPEGIYKISAFNPNSLYHLSLRVNYPNAFDRTQAVLEKRSNLGGDIMIHGSNCSIGCIAIGDEKIEELFTLVRDVSKENTSLLIAPCDLRLKDPEIDYKHQPSWLPELYRNLRREMADLPV